MKTKEEDYVVDAFVTSSHNFILFFTTRGRVFKLKAYQIPQTQRYSKGKAIINLLPELESDEKIFSTIPISEFDDQHNIIFATKRGIVKKTPLSKYRHIYRIGIIAIALWEDDELVETKLSDGAGEIFIGTKFGQAIRFREDRVRPMGRNTHGVKGIRLREGDEVVGMALISPSDIPGNVDEEVLVLPDEVLDDEDKAGLEEVLEDEDEAGVEEVEILEEEGLVSEDDQFPKLLTITENGYGKRSCPSTYRKTNRGGKGVITIITDERNGNVISIKSVQSAEQLLISTIGGMMIRIPVNGISIIGRATKGVRLMRLNEGDKVTSVAVVASEDSDDEDGSEGEMADTDDMEEEGMDGGVKDAGLPESEADEQESEGPGSNADEQESEGLGSDTDEQEVEGPEDDQGEGE